MTPEKARGVWAHVCVSGKVSLLRQDNVHMPVSLGDKITYLSYSHRSILVHRLELRNLRVRITQSHHSLGLIPEVAPLPSGSEGLEGRQKAPSSYVKQSIHCISPAHHFLGRLWWRSVLWRGPVSYWVKCGGTLRGWEWWLHQHLHGT